MEKLLFHNQTKQGSRKKLVGDSTQAKKACTDFSEASRSYCNMRRAKAPI